MKYKTIIFPTISNPIFRDTYLYSDLFPQFKNLSGIDRETKVLKRVTSNYYTVEELKKKSEVKSEIKLNEATKNIQMQFNQTIQREVNKARKTAFLKEESPVNDFIENLANKLFTNNEVTVNESEESYTLLINKIINKIEVKEIEDYTLANYSLSVSRNLSKGFTKITIWDSTKEKRI